MAAAALLALVLCLLHLLFDPQSGTDLAAQVARAAFAREAPLTPVDLSWFSGTHPYGYSVLTPAIMAVLGVGLAGLLAGVAAAALLAHLLRGSQHPLAGALLGAVFSAADVTSGRITFALGAVAALGSLAVLDSRPGTARWRATARPAGPAAPARPASPAGPASPTDPAAPADPPSPAGSSRRWPAAALAVLTALLSPVAAAFLGLAALVLVLHRRAGGWSTGLAAALPVALVGLLFPAGGVQPFRTDTAWWAVTAGLLLALLTDRPVLRTGGLLYAGAVLFFVSHHDPFGSNILRLGLLLAAPLVVATSRRAVPLLLVAAVVLVQWQVKPTLADLRAPAPPPTRTLERALARLDSRRVEVVPLRDHREAATVARHVPLARGWSRQADFAENALFYDGHLTAGRFLGWLHRHSVDAVALAPAARLDGAGRVEARLLADPLPGLQRVFADRYWTVWQVRQPVPLAAAPVRVVASRPTRLVLSAPGQVQSRVDVRWSRWLSVHGPACIAREGDRVRIRFRSAGTAVLGSGLRPHGHC